MYLVEKNFNQPKKSKQIVATHTNKSKAGVRMRVLICDSCSDVRDRLYRMLNDAGMQVVGRVDSLDKAGAIIKNLRPEVMLMDAKLLTSLALFRTLRAELTYMPALIMMGAQEDCNVLAFKAGASDFILKPLDRLDVMAALDKVTKLNAAQQVALSKKTTAATGQKRQFIAARTHRGMELIALSDVYYFTADQKYVKVRHKNGIVLIDESLKDLEAEFGDAMFRIHRNALINLDYLELLESVEAGQYQVRFRGTNEALVVSRRHLPTLRDRIHSI